jgi:hypothetical protein
MRWIAAEINHGVGNDWLKRFADHAAREIFQADITSDHYGNRVKDEHAECGKKKGALC